MQSSVKKLFSLTDNRFTDVSRHRLSERLVGVLPRIDYSGKSRSPKALVDQRALPGPVSVDSTTPMFQARQQTFERPILAENPTPVAEEDACRIIEATLLYKNGPNGGWCWLVATDCGDQYQKGDCWYTEAVHETYKSNH